jgi:hypothetical protein
VKRHAVVLLALVLTSGCAGVDRSLAIEACALISGINDAVPNPRAGQPLSLPPNFPTIPGFAPREPDFVGPSEAELRSRIAAARSKAAASGDEGLQRLADAMRVSRDSDGRPRVYVAPILPYCAQQGW